jgi:RimJ/RimL family protein N-acetyltransferase
MTLRPATPDDFAFIRSLAQRPDYAPFITDEDEAGLADYLSNPGDSLLIWDLAGTARGFALYCGLDHPNGVIELRRLALASVGQGEGRPFLRAMIDHAFQVLGAQRLWLDASSENPRAMAAYIRAGFTPEGRMRSHWHRPALGRTVDLMLYGMLRDEWLGLEPLALEPAATRP